MGKLHDVTAAPMTRPALEVAQIFRRHGPAYRKNHGLAPAQHQALRDIERCRTARLGGHLDACSRGCGYLAISYNSCRNRHCPKCQSLKQAQWLAARRQRLLPVPYFHLVVTLPHELKPLARFNPALMFNLLFESASQALLQFARDYVRLGAQVGFTAVLHTWDQDLNFHPHLHLVVTGGGLSPEGDRWIAARNSFLLPVRALSKIIRGKFLQALEKAFREGRLKGQVACLEEPGQFPRFLRQLRRKKWVVYAKGAFGGSQKAYQYLSRYTHRVAIANHRLVSLAEGQVSFRARDNSRPGHQRLVTITAPEFIRRFLGHVLPPRFVKIRHFGLMAPANARTKLEQARALLSLQAPEATAAPPGLELGTPSQTNTWQDMLRALTGLDLTLCPNCGQGRIIRAKLTGHETALAPPQWDSS
jgi:Putative transposase/Transposase zinc-binding domain